jgi:3-deoxy-D-manno-octulosonic-acid transferase
VALLLAVLLRRGRLFLGERFGFWKASNRPTILIHGASLGEVKGVLPLARALRAKYTDHEIVISSTSSTGREAADAAGFVGRILPLDIYWLYILAFSEINLKLCIISETEIWPGLISWLEFNRIPWGIVNGRISDKSWGEYLALSPFLRPFISLGHFFGVADQKSYDRFVQLGARFGLIKKTGNTKYDSVVPTLSPDEVLKLRSSLVGDVKTVVVLGSIRPGEDLIWNQVIKIVLQRYDNVAFVLAPRHPEKFDFFADSLRDSGIKFARRQDGKSDRVLLLDSLGELTTVYTCCHIAFVGGTLEPFGGHNPLEAMTQGCAILMGPSTFVISDVVDVLIEKDAVRMVRTKDECLETLCALLDNPDSLQKLQTGAKEASKDFFGATERTVEMISGIMR